MVSFEGTRRPSLVDQHGTADFPLDAPDVSGLLRQSSVLSVRARRQSTTRSTTFVVKMVEPQRLLLRDTHPVWFAHVYLHARAPANVTSRKRGNP